MNQNFREPAQNTIYAAENRMGAFQYETLSSYTTKTFGWMFAGLAVTFVTALGFYLSDLALVLFRIPFMWLILGIAEFAVVISMTAQMRKLTVSGAKGRFFTYAIINGIVFSSYFYMFQMFDLVLAFGTTALYFGLMAGYGYVTKKDLSGWAKPLMFGVIAMLIVSLIGMFFGGFNVLMCCAGIILFACYTAYDTQKIKAAYFAYAGNAELAKKASIYAALELYLDFVNLFLYILQMFARNRDN